MAGKITFLNISDMLPKRLELIVYIFEYYKYK